MESYVQIWLRYCNRNSIWFSVCGNGVIDEVTDTDRGITEEAPGTCVFGSKQAYEWLMMWHTKLKTEKGD